MQIQNVAFVNEGLQITYMEDRDFDEQTGIVEVRVLSIPHEVITHELMADLQDSVLQIVDAAAIARRRPAASFTVRS